MHSAAPTRSGIEITTTFTADVRRAPSACARRAGSADLRGGGGRDARGGELDPGVVQAFVDHDLQGVAGLVVHLRDTLVRAGRRREVAPPVGLERAAKRDAQA